VFEGGGVKGIAFVGALQAFEEAGFHWQNVAGTSAGSSQPGTPPLKCAKLWRRTLSFAG